MIPALSKPFGRRGSSDLEERLKNRERNRYRTPPQSKNPFFFYACYLKFKSAASNVGFKIQKCSLSLPEMTALMDNFL